MSDCALSLSLFLSLSQEMCVCLKNFYEEGPHLTSTKDCVFAPQLAIVSQKQRVLQSCSLDPLHTLCFAFGFAFGFTVRQDTHDRAAVGSSSLSYSCPYS
jgi:hypothetical protein